MKSYLKNKNKNKTRNWRHPTWQFFCSMSNPVLVSQSDVSLPLLLPFLMATLSCQWVTPHLWLPDVCFSSPGIIHITQVHWYQKKKCKKKNSQTQLCVLLKSFIRVGGLCMQLFSFFFFVSMRMKTGQHTHPILDWSVQCDGGVSLLSRQTQNELEHDVLWIIPVSSSALS